jgi:hypothetical protein
MKIIFRLASYHIDVEMAQKGTQSLPDDGIALPKHVAAIVKNKAIYNSGHLLVNLYLFDDVRYKNQNSVTYFTFLNPCNLIQLLQCKQTNLHTSS